jgi:HD-GYP domain-containing protein (c-di-GMP phosphodiesterase class II)
MDTREALELDQSAREFVHHFNVLLKHGYVYKPTNDALKKPARQLSDTIRKLCQYDPKWFIRIHHEHLFIGENRIHLTMEITSHYMNFIEEFKKRGLGMISISRVPSESEVIKFLYLFLNHHEDEGVLKLQGKFMQSGLPYVDVEALMEEEFYLDPEDKGQVRRIARESFFRSIFMTEGIFRAVDQNKPFNIRRARRVIQSLTELLNLDENYMLGLTSIKNYDAYTFNHSVNVTILALNMGRRMGLDRTTLTDLGLSAIFHDLGKTSLSQEIINKGHNLDEAEWQAMYRHPVEGVKKLLRLKGVSELTVKLVISVYEHHINYDLTGYPETDSNRELSLFSRILRIVDSYDAMTTKRIYRDLAKHPVAAVEEIWTLGGKTFDPALVKVFANMMGVYPIGTIVQMDSGEIGIVNGVHRDVEPGRQEIITVLTDWENLTPTGSVIDLAVETGKKVVGYYDFGKESFDPSQYLLSLTD